LLLLTFFHSRYTDDNDRGRLRSNIRLEVRQGRAVEGYTAEFVVDLLIGFVFLHSCSWRVILVMARTATIVETVVNKIDDDLLIPLYSGFNAQILTYMISLGIPSTIAASVALLDRFIFYIFSLGFGYVCFTDLPEL